MPKKNITNPSDLGPGAKKKIKDVVEAIGPQVLGDEYPKDDDGQPKAELSAREASDVFEAVTRRFWSDQIRALEANRAAEQARMAALESSAEDPFED